MFAQSTPEIETFRTMFDNADKTPILIQEKATEFDVFVSTDLPETKDLWLRIESIDQAAGTVRISSTELHQLYIFDISGKLIQQTKDKSGHYRVSLNKQSGVYIFKFVNKRGHTHIEKIPLY
jgi:hypothetical protein